MAINAIDPGDMTAIPAELLKDVRNGDHLRKIGGLENDSVIRVQINLRIMLIELLKSGDHLTPENFAHRKMQLITMVPSDLHDISTIHDIIHEVRNAKQSIKKPKPFLQIIGDALKKFL